MKDGINGRKLHLEVTVDPVYKADELCSYEIPETVDPFSVTAQLIGTTLVVEAPLLCTV
ncbi:unnamed protein product [Trichobilharzia regenti]|nr:unnamed protein product [Trichobilharzia regenti]